MNTPRNHHYVPQHFLKAWQSSEGKIYSYRVNPYTKLGEVKEASIKRSASQKDLYHIAFHDGGFEIETTIINPYIDDDGAGLIELARNTVISDWSNEKQLKLARYIVCLEARHPDVVDIMNISLSEIKERFKQQGIYSDEAVDDVFDYFGTTQDVGKVALSALVQNEELALLEEPFADGLVRSDFIEITLKTDQFICSNYPTGRWGHFLENVLLFLAISPTKALIYSADSRMAQLYKSLPESVVIDLVNLYTLGNATIAYHTDNKQLEFVTEHLGWAKKLKSLDEQREYVGKFFDQALARA
ncbi:DUF4238 domain-containing protein [Vibrio cholerae]|nr:DUF4238 domain-containing protein [Vibrio cholerae]HDB1451178.1 DUF4238 domain-containing protein [Vibrio cholerae]